MRKIITKELSILLSILLILVAMIPVLMVTGCSPIAPGANNIVMEPGTTVSIATTSPVQPTSGAPVRYGYLTGIALTTYRTIDNLTTVDFGNFVAYIPVTAVGNVAAGDALYYRDSITGVTNYSTGTYYYGVAMGAVTSGNTTYINVVHTPSPGAGTLGSGTVGATNLASNSVITAKILDANVTLAKIAPNTIDGTVAANIATGDAVGGLSLLHEIDIPTGTTGNVDTTFTYKEKITNCWLIKNTVAAAADANTIQLFNATSPSAITNAMSLNATAAGAVVNAGNIYSENATITAGTVLRIARTNAGVGNVGCYVYVRTVRVP